MPRIGSDRSRRTWQGAPPIETITSRPDPGAKSRYNIGTTALVSTGNEAFLCVVLARTNTTSSQVSATAEDLIQAVRGCLKKARMVCSGRPLVFPLLGSGLARTGIKPHIIVHLMLLAIFEETKVQKVTNNIRIVLHKDLRTTADLTTIQREWS